MTREGNGVGVEQGSDQPQGGRRALVMAGVLVPLVALLALLAWAMVQSGGRPAGIAVNNMFGEVELREGPARDFSLTLFDGGELRLSDMRGTVVMVDFWSSWCAPCRQEAPALEAAYERFRDQGVEFVGVAIWDSEEAATDFIDAAGQRYPSGLDSKGAIAIDYGVTGIPEKYFVDRDGMLAKKFVGPVTQMELERVLSELLAR